MAKHKRKSKPTNPVKKEQPMVLPTLQLHEVAQGHRPMQSGAGYHCVEPNRQRTRMDANRQAIRASLDA